MNNQLATQEQVNDQTLIMHLDNLGLTKNLTDGEKNTYLQIAKAYNLNPFKREIHVSKYKDQMSVITGYEVYIKRAERSGQLDGWVAKTTGSVANGDLKGIVIIYRKDRQHPFEWEVPYNEFCQSVEIYENQKPTGKFRPTKFWLKAEFMIKKVAIAQAFRLCFSDELGGMPYTPEETPQQTEDVPHEVVKTQPAAIAPPAPPPKKKKFKNAESFSAALNQIKDGVSGFVEKVEGLYDFTEQQSTDWANEKIRATNAALNASQTPAT